MTQWILVDPLQAIRDYQQGRCAVCDEPRARLVVDHDHDSGLVRGLLCNGCNSSEGRDFRAPWFRAYRANPPAMRLGLSVKYGQHKPRRRRVIASKLRPDRWSRLDLEPWLNAMITEAEKGSEAGPAPCSDNSDAYRELCARCGYAPVPVNVSLVEWRAALREAYLWSMKSPSGTWTRERRWQARASRAFAQLSRDRETGTTYLQQYAESS